jgi:adenosine deaminase
LPEVLLPSVLLHDHLDGGLRPQTVIELAAAVGHSLPADDAHSLAAYFDQKRSGSLERYLEAFTHTIAVMQTRTALKRVAREAAEDLLEDGVVYAEVRFAPLLHTRRGLTGDEVVEAVVDGLSEVPELAWGLILCAIRSDRDSDRVAELAIRHSPRVVAFDLAGPEKGHPPERHLPAIRRVREYGLGVTLHAGEAAGPGSIASALLRCGADRIGHGVDVVEDCVMESGEIRSVGRLAGLVRDRRVPLEICPSSNLATKRWAAEQHPVGALHRAGFTVTINTDNRLMSATRQSAELELVARRHGFGIDDLALVARRSLAAAFCPEPLRRELWENRIAPAYRKAGASVSLRWEPGS